MVVSLEHPMTLVARYLLTIAISDTDFCPSCTQRQDIYSFINLLYITCFQFQSLARYTNAIAHSFICLMYHLC